MIDLSFLTEAEQEAILKVLNRDAELKKAEEERVKHLQDVVNNENEFKYKSGQWFYEAKSRRHREKIHGADLVRASIRKRKKPATIAELSELNKDSSKRRWVNSVNQDIFIPPELYGVMEAPDEAEEDVMVEKQEGNQSSKRVSFSAPEKEQDKLRNGTLSPPKPRLNPFNSEGLQDETEYNNEAPSRKPENLPNGTEKSKSDIMSSLAKYGVKLPYPAISKGTQNSPRVYDDDNSQKQAVQVPVPKPRTLRMNGQPQDQSNSQLKRDDSFNGTGRPRGILKRRSSSSSTDSESIRISQGIESSKIALPGSPILEAGQYNCFDEQDVTSDNSPDRQKQVRFSEKIQQKPPSPSPGPYSGKEIGEYGILDPSLSVNCLDNGFVDLNNSEDSILDKDIYPIDSVTKVLEQNAALENQGVSLIEQPASLELTPKDLSKSDLLRLEASTDISIEPPSNNSSGGEPLYSVVKKTSAASAPSQEDFDLDDALMEPRFHGQRGKTQNIYLNEKPLEFGKSFSGRGKITFESNSPSKQQQEVYTFSSEELTPESARNTETSHKNLGYKPVAIAQDDEPVESGAFWRRPIILGTQEPRPPSLELTEEQKTSMHILQDSPGVDLKAEETYPENLTFKTAPGEYSKDTKYKSIFQNRFDAEHEPVALASNIPVAQNMSESSKTDGQLDRSLLHESKGRKDLPKSTHFKVTSLKERMNEMPREQMSNPSQFQSLKHFWNVEEKNLLRGTTVTSPDKILAHVSNRNKPAKTDLKQRSLEKPADEGILPSTLDNLSEEEQTSQKVASWLAQTPSVYGVSQMDPDEDRSYSREEILEHVQKSTVPKKSDEELAKALQKLREEALEVPKQTEMESTGKITIMPQLNPDAEDLKKTTITISPISKKSIEATAPALDSKTSDAGFYERVLQISKNPSPAKETVSMEPSSNPLEENKAKTVAPEKSASEFNFNFVKFKSDISEKEVQKEASLPKKENVAEEVIQKSAVPKSKDQQDFIAALKRLEIEASKPPPLPEVEAELQDKLVKEDVRQNEASPVKSSKMSFVRLGSARETNELETPTDHSVGFQIQNSYAPNKEPGIEDSSDLEEIIEKTMVPSRKDNQDLSIALRKLELESIEHQSDDDKYVVGINQKVEFEEPEHQVALQTSLPEYNSNIKYSSDDGKCMDDLDQPPTVTSYELNLISNTSQTDRFEQEKSPVAEEPSIERTRVKSQESGADFHNRLLRLEEQARIPEAPEELLDNAIKVSQLPNRDVLISQKVFSSIESMPTSIESSSESGKAKEVDSPTSKPKDFDLKSLDYSRNEELANDPHSHKPSGSYTGNGNMLYKKPEVGSPEVSNSKPGMDESHPILSALKRSEAKTLNYKAVQEVSPTSTNQLNSSNPTEDTPAPTVNTFPQNADTLKRLSQSVPAFIQDENDGRDTDSASESSFQIGRHKKSPSSLTNLSGSSGMASMSSVSGSVMSIYSGDFGNVDIKGAIEFSIDYVEKLKEFLIYIYQCRELAVAEVKKQRSDPYVKAYLLPEKAKMGKRKTAVKKKTLNPVYNEILRYKIPKQSLVAQTLNLSVWHHDALGRNSFLGEVNVNLETWDWSNSQRRWYQLEPRTPAAGMGLENRGEMKLSLKYVPHSPTGPNAKPTVTGEVYIWIKECLQLPMLRENKINSFVKCTVLPDTSRKSRQKTRTVDKTPNPIFNHTMVYDGFKEEDLREACVELTVWDHNRLSNHFLGGLRIGLGSGKSYGTAVDWMDSTHEESTMWEKMMISPNTWVDGMLPLRMFKMAKLAK